MARRYSPAAATHHVLAVRPRERVAVEEVSNYLAGLAETGEITARRYAPSRPPHASPAPRSREEGLVEPARIEVEGVRWFVARAMSGCERRVARDLAEAGFRTYCPLGRRFVGQARLAGGKRRKAVRQFAVFAPYVFVGCAAGLEIGKSSHERIESVISDADGPIAVAARIIAGINDLELAGQWYDALAWRGQTRLKVGSQVYVSGGPFAGLSGIVAGLPAEMRVRIDLSLFGRATPAVIDACQVEPV